MRKRIFFNLVCVLCFAAGFTLFHPTYDVKAQRRGSSSQRINGTVVGIGGRFAGRSRPFTLIVNGYTSVRCAS